MNIIFGFIVAAGFDNKLGEASSNPEHWGGIAAFVIGMTIVAR